VIETEKNLNELIRRLEIQIKGQEYAIEHLKRENRKLRRNLEWRINQREQV